MSYVGLQSQSVSNILHFPTVSTLFTGCFFFSRVVFQQRLFGCFSQTQALQIVTFASSPT